MAATVAPAGHICVLRSNGDDGNRIPLDASAAATVTFGRALTSDVRIALAHCSRLHAELRVDQNARVSLVNHAKAANATLLNAQPLAPKAARDVRDGDVFEICGKRFRFEASVLAATTTMASITEEENVTAEKRDVAKPLPSGLLQAITARRRSSVLGRPAKIPGGGAMPGGGGGGAAPGLRPGGRAPRRCAMLFMIAARSAPAGCSARLGPTALCF